MSRPLPYVLPGALRPGPGESLAGLVMRNAERLRFPNPMRVLARIAPGTGALSTFVGSEPDAATTDRLAVLLGIGRDELRAMAPWHPEAGRSAVRGAPIDSTLYTVLSRRACPGCIAEDGHDRAWWYVSPLVVCPRHRREVLRACPGCGKRLAWFGVGLHRCGNRGCGHDLRSDAPPVPAPPVGHARGLLGMLEAHASDDAPPAAHGLDFGRAVDFAFRVGSLVRGDDRPGRVSSFAKSRRAELPGLMEDGWDALQDWPRGFHAALDHARKRADERGGFYGLRRELGRLPLWVGSLEGQTWAGPLRAAFASYVEARGDLRTSSAGLRRLGTPEVLRARRATLSDAAGRLGV